MAASFTYDFRVLRNNKIPGNGGDTDVPVDAKWQRILQ